MSDPCESDIALGIVKEDFGDLSHRLCKLLQESGPLTKEQLLLALCAGHPPLAPPPPPPPEALAGLPWRAPGGGGGGGPGRPAPAGGPGHQSGAAASSAASAAATVSMGGATGFTASAAAARAASLGSRTSADPTLPSLPQTPAEVQGCLAALTIHGIVQPRAEGAGGAPSSSASSSSSSSQASAGTKRKRGGAGGDAGSAGPQRPRKPSARIRYEFAPREALRRLQLPRVLERVRRRLGAVAQAIAEALSMYGSMTVGRLRMATDLLLEDEMEDGADGEGEAERMRDDDSDGSDEDGVGGATGARRGDGASSTGSGRFDRAWTALRQQRLVRRSRGLVLPPDLLAGTSGALPAQGLSGSVRDVGRGALATLGVDAGGPDRRDEALRAATGSQASMRGGGGPVGEGEAELDEDEDEDEDDGLGLGLGLGPRGGKRGKKKRKQPKKSRLSKAQAKRSGGRSGEEKEADGPGDGEEAEQLWCLDPRPLTYLDRTEAVVLQVQDAVSPTGARIVRAMLDKGPPPEAPSLPTSLQTLADRARGEGPGGGSAAPEAEWSAEVTAREILEQLQRDFKRAQKAGEAWTQGERAVSWTGASHWKTLGTLLEVMRSEPLEVVERVGLGADGGSWRVRVGRLVSRIMLSRAEELARVSAVAGAEARPAHQQAAASEEPQVRRAARSTAMQHGIGCRRVLNYLRAKGQVQDKAVADGTLLSLKDAQGHLFTLMRLGIARNFPLPRRADHAPGLTVYLWDAPEHLERAALARKCLQAVRNVVLRRRHEEKRLEEVTRAAAAAGEVAQRARAGLVQRVRHGVERLDAAAARLAAEFEQLMEW